MQTRMLISGQFANSQWQLPQLSSFISNFFRYYSCAAFLSENIFCNCIKKPSVASGAAVAQRPDLKTSANPGCKPHWCCNCKVVVLGNGVQKSIKDLPSHMKVLSPIRPYNMLGQVVGYTVVITSNILI